MLDKLQHKIFCRNHTAVSYYSTIINPNFQSGSHFSQTFYTTISAILLFISTLLGDSHFTVWQVSLKKKPRFDRFLLEASLSLLIHIINHKELFALMPSVIWKTELFRISFINIFKFYFTSLISRLRK